jgi:cell division septal protein FtsQ
MAKKIKIKRQRPVLRRRKAPSLAGLIVRLIPLVLILAIIAIAGKMSVSLLFDSDIFKVKDIRVIGENQDDVVADITKNLNSAKKTNIFKVDIKKYESDISQRHPEFKDLRVRRILPDALEVSYIIRKPYLQVECGSIYLASDDAVILPGHPASKDANMPTVTGISVTSKKGIFALDYNNTKALKKAIALFKEIASSSFSKEYKVTKIDMHDLSNPSLYMDDATRIEIGESSFRSKERVLAEALKDLELKGKKAKMIDLRFEDVIVVPKG